MCCNNQFKNIITANIRNLTSLKGYKKSEVLFTKL
jgi:hypothetical protein